MNTTTKVGTSKYGKKRTDTTKTAGKRIVQKSAEATGDLIGNKIADEITSLGKSKNIKKKKRKQMKKKKLLFHQKKDSKSLTT